jgi:hypothetical protein
VSSPVLALQMAYVARIKATAGLASVPVFDRVPNQQPMPYIHVFDMQAIEDGAGCMDHDEVFATLQIWSRAPNRVEVRRLAEQVRNALHHWYPDLTAQRCAVIEHEVQSVRDFLETDGETSRAVLTIRAQIERQ